MRTYSTALNNYRNAGKAFWPIHFISIKVKQIDDPSDFILCNYCTSDDDMTVTITDPDTGSPISRTFAGGGHIVRMGDLTRSEGAVIRSHQFTMSGASSLVLDMIHGYNCREALFQWFTGELDQDTGLLIDEPPCELVGFVNTIELQDTALLPEGSDAVDSLVRISVDSLAAALTDRNYDMRSLDVSEQRGGDKFFEFADSAHHWNVRWGKEKKREKDRKKRDKGKSNNNDGTGRVRTKR